MQESHEVVWLQPDCLCLYMNKVVDSIVDFLAQPFVYLMISHELFYSTPDILTAASNHRMQSCR